MGKKKHQKGKIYLTFNNVCARTDCVISGVSFKPDLLMFCLNGDSERPVLDSVALEKGFTMTEEDFETLGKYYFESISKRPGVPIPEDDIEHLVHIVDNIKSKTEWGIKSAVKEDEGLLF